MRDAISYIGIFKDDPTLSHYKTVIVVIRTKVRKWSYSIKLQRKLLYKDGPINLQSQILAFQSICSQKDFGLAIDW